MALLVTPTHTGTDGGGPMGMNEKPCSKCEYARRVCAGPGNWFFKGCYYGDYHGKWVIEIEKYPKKAISQTEEQMEATPWPSD